MVYYERGVVYQMMGNHELAIKDFEEALSKDNKFADALFNIGKSRLKNKMVEQAEEDFKKALDLSDRPEMYEGLGLCYHMKLDFD